MNNKILITGAAGFIGFHISKLMLEENYEICGVDNINNYYSISLKNDRLSLLEKYPNFTFNKVDISNYNQVSKIFKKFQPDIVINLAAQAGVRYSIENPFAYVESNLIGFVNIIELCRKNDSGLSGHFTVGGTN